MYTIYMYSLESISTSGYILFPSNQATLTRTLLTSFWNFLVLTQINYYYCIWCSFLTKHAWDLFIFKQQMILISHHLLLMPKPSLYMHLAWQNNSQKRSSTWEDPFVLKLLVILLSRHRHNYMHASWLLIESTGYCVMRRGLFFQWWLYL